MKNTIVINTLGPNTTDSYRATCYWIEKQNLTKYKIKTHESFEKLFDELIDSEYILMPAGYSNRKSEKMASWVDFHFRYVDELVLENVFTLNTMPMVLVENINYRKKGIVIQSSTYQFSYKIFKKYSEQLIYVPSKSRALDLFLEKDYHFTICSEEVFLNNKCDEEKYIIIEKFNPIMIWVIYKIMKKVNL